MKQSAVKWFDIPTSDFLRAVKFYSEILGQKIKIGKMMGQELGFFPTSGKGIGGNIIPPALNRRPSEDGVRIYMNCEKVLDEVLDRVEGAGGKIVEKKFSIGQMGWAAFIEDSEGNIIGLLSSK